MLVASTAEESATLAARRDALAAAGLDARLLTAAEARAAEPALQLGEAGSALLVPTDAQVSGRATAAALLRACQAHGPRFTALFNEGARRLAAGESGRVELVHTDARRSAAEPWRLGWGQVPGLCWQSAARERQPAVRVLCPAWFRTCCLTSRPLALPRPPQGARAARRGGCPGRLERRLPCRAAGGRAVGGRVPAAPRAAAGDGAAGGHAAAGVRVDGDGVHAGGCRGCAALRCACWAELACRLMETGHTQAGAGAALWCGVLCAVPSVPCLLCCAAHAGLMETGYTQAGAVALIPVVLCVVLCWPVLACGLC